MRRAIRFFGPMFLAWMLFYLLGSFGEWSPDPGQWREGSRWLVAGLAAFFGIAAACIASEELP